MTSFRGAAVPLICGTLAFALVVACGERPARSVAHEGGEVGDAPSFAALPLPPGAAASPSPSPPTPADPSSEARLALAIPPREHAHEAPPAGWCGETAIQEGLLHLGVWAPQRIINKAGRPTHPDLYSPDIPVALAELGVRYTFFGGGRGDGSFEEWIKKALDAGDPVLAGVKILPTAHPEWGLDHFVLVVGYGDKGLLVNTTWGHRLWVASTTTPGLSFKNAFYALRLGGVSVAGAGRAARLELLEEGDAKVKLRVTCEARAAVTKVRIEQRRARADERPIWSEEVSVVSARGAKEISVEAQQIARFQCVPAQ